MQRIGTFLGLVSPGTRTASPSVKKSSDDLRDRTKNLGELEDIVQERPLQVRMHPGATESDDSDCSRALSQAWCVGDAGIA